MSASPSCELPRGNTTLMTVRPPLVSTSTRSTSSPRWPVTWTSLRSQPRTSMVPDTLEITTSPLASAATLRSIGVVAGECRERQRAGDPQGGDDEFLNSLMIRSPGCRSRAPRSARAFLPGRNSLTTLAAAHWPDRVRAPLRYRRSNAAAWRRLAATFSRSAAGMACSCVCHFDQQRVALLAVIRVAQRGGHDVRLALRGGRAGDRVRTAARCRGR